MYRPTVTVTVSVPAHCNCASVLSQSQHTLPQLHSTNYVNRMLIRRKWASRCSSVHETSAAAATAAAASRDAVICNYIIITNQCPSSYVTTVTRVCVLLLVSHYRPTLQSATRLLTEHCYVGKMIFCQCAYVRNVHQTKAHMHFPWHKSLCDACQELQRCVWIVKVLDKIYRWPLFPGDGADRL